MAQSRATTPACDMPPGVKRQRGTTPSVLTSHQPIILNSATKGMNMSLANESRPRLLGGITLPKANYPKHQPKLQPKRQPPKPSPPKKSAGLVTRVTRQNDGTLPGAPERFVPTAAVIVDKVKKASLEKRTTKSTAKTGAGIKKPGASAKKTAFKSSSPTKKTPRIKETAKSPAKSAAKSPAKSPTKSPATSPATKSPAKKAPMSKKAGVTKYSTSTKKANKTTTGKSPSKR